MNPITKTECSMMASVIAYDLAKEESAAEIADLRAKLQAAEDRGFEYSKRATIYLSRAEAEEARGDDMKNRNKILRDENTELRKQSIPLRAEVARLKEALRESLICLQWSVDPDEHDVRQATREMIATYWALLEVKP